MIRFFKVCPSAASLQTIKSGSFQTVAACEGLVVEGKRIVSEENPHDVEENQIQDMNIFKIYVLL